MPFLTVYHFQRVLVMRRKFEEKSVFVFPCLKKIPKFSVQISLIPWIDLTEKLPRAPLVLGRL